MAQREWVEKDFYKELGVSSDASADEIKRAYRKLARELHPDTQLRTPSAAETVQGGVRGASVLSDPAKRKEYDETRRLFARRRIRPGPVRAAATSADSAATAPSST